MARDIGSLLGGAVMNRILGFVAFAYLARVLSPANYGYVELAVWIALLGSMVIDSGHGPIAIREMAKDPSNAHELAAHITGSRLILASIVIPIIVAVPFVFPEYRETRLLVILYAFSLIGVAWKLDWLFQGLEKMHIVAVGNTVRAFMHLLAVFVLVQSDDDLWLVGIVEIVAMFLMALYFIYFRHKYLGSVGITFSLQKFKSFSGRGLSLGLSNLIWTGIQALPLFFVAGMMVDENETAWFAATQRIVVAMLTFCWLYHFNLYPSISRKFHGDTNSMHRVIGSSLRVSAWGSVILICFIGFISNPLLSILYGQKFAIAAPVLTLLVWAFPLTLLSGHFRWSLIAGGGERKVFLAHIAGFITMIIVSIALIPSFGALGAAGGMVSASLVILLTSIFFARSVLPVWVMSRDVVLPLLLGIIVSISVRELVESPLIAALIGCGILTVISFLERRLLNDLRILVRAKG